MTATADPWNAYVVPAPRDVLTPRPPDHDVVVERDLRIPLRDGTVLAAMLWRPAGAGPWPVLVERSPMRFEERTGPAGEYHAARGVAVLGVALRGCLGSGGEFGIDVGSPEGDGYDTVEWVAAQPWCNGRVGLICGSISGYTAYQTLVEAPLHLMPTLVREGPISMYHGAEPSAGILTAQQVATTWTEHRLASLPPEQHSQAQVLLDTWQRDVQAAGAAASGTPFQIVPEMARRLPVVPNPLFQGIADYYETMLRTPTPEEQRTSVLARAERVTVPVCHLGGWFDGLTRHSLDAFQAMRAHAATPAARAGQRLLIGPWVHGPANTHGKPVGLLEFGPNAALDFFAFRQRWVDAYLDGARALDADPIVWLYLMGPDRWLGFDSWPPPTQPTPWYLNTHTLALQPPTTEQLPDAFEYDPGNPVPSLADGGALNIGADQRPVEDRLLTYTSPPLDAPLTLVGPVTTILYAASSVPDTDWFVRLTLVRPDGASVILTGGALRARFRHSPLAPSLLEPNKPERFEIDMMPISVVIPAGHSLRLTVTSSDFPAFDRNLNTGGPLSREAAGQVAINRVYHDAQLPSHIILPVLR
ncbi:MAG: CocE/NonD family hydrolase [Caldilineaceae bacterium]|nr:CocE/NonD family hydrolase [Caldilineaceae bacterium]